MMTFFMKYQDKYNNRPNCLLSNIQKLFMKIVTTGEGNEPREQAGFRSKHSTIDHIHVATLQPQIK